MAESLDKCSINVFLQFYIQIPKKFFKLNTDYIDFNQMVLNAREAIVA